MCRGDTRSSGTDIQRLSQFNELRARRIHAAKKNRYLEANTRGLAALLQAFTLLLNLKFKTPPVVPTNEYDSAYSRPRNRAREICLSHEEIVGYRWRRRRAANGLV